VPVQQRSVAAQDVSSSRQIEPAGWQAFGFEHRPSAAPAALEQVTCVV
jgi:hypothetical protein